MKNCVSDLDQSAISCIYAINTSVVVSLRSVSLNFKYHISVLNLDCIQSTISINNFTHSHGQHISLRIIKIGQFCFKIWYFKLKQNMHWNLYPPPHNHKCTDRVNAHKIVDRIRFEFLGFRMAMVKIHD